MPWPRPWKPWWPKSLRSSAVMDLARAMPPWRANSSRACTGAQLYRNYCAACHGVEGKGDGQVARFLKGPPADLSTLAQRNDGKYPADRVAATLDNGTDSGVHGTSDMPIWGPVFQSRGKDVAQTRIRKVTEFVESLQQK
jgi:mono/diheme cytochrome c family protein